jgi:hypothetical protein
MEEWDQISLLSWVESQVMVSRLMSVPSETSKQINFYFLRTKKDGKFEKTNKSEKRKKQRK